MNGTFAPVYSRSLQLGAFGDWVKAKRKEQSLTLKGMEALTGVSYGAISDWERGRRTPHRDTAVEIATALGADPREALEALMADTPGLEPLPEMTSEPDEEYLQDALMAYAKERLETEGELLPGFTLTEERQSFAIKFASGKGAGEAAETE
jgi:transcriptional regulator with XRE-family HTH domain